RDRRSSARLPTPLCATRRALRSATCGASRRSASGALDAQAGEAVFDRARGTLERALVLAQVVGEVRAEEDRVDLERELRGVDARMKMPFVDREKNRFLDRADPVIHRRLDGVAHRTAAAVKLERRRGEKAAAGED